MKSSSFPLSLVARQAMWVGRVRNKNGTGLSLDLIKLTEFVANRERAFCVAAHRAATLFCSAVHCADTNASLTLIPCPGSVVCASIHPVHNHCFTLCMTGDF